jgi:hypothetical protein
MVIASPSLYVAASSRFSPIGLERPSRRKNLETFFMISHRKQLDQTVYFKRREMSMKAAIVVLSDPKAGTEEALGRVFNALASAYDFKKRGTPVRLLFQGAGTRWAGELTKSDHPAHALYEEVKDTIEGVSFACAGVFGATEAAKSHGFELIKENVVPGTAGLPSLGRLVADGYTVLTF